MTRIEEIDAKLVELAIKESQTEDAWQEARHDSLIAKDGLSYDDATFRAELESNRFGALAGIVRYRRELVHERARILREVGA
jgi:hypothetical protein